MPDPSVLPPLVGREDKLSECKPGAVGSPLKSGSLINLALMVLFSLSRTEVVAALGIFNADPLPSVKEIALDQV